MKSPGEQLDSHDADGLLAFHADPPEPPRIMGVWGRIWGDSITPVKGATLIFSDDVTIVDRGVEVGGEAEAPFNEPPPFPCNGDGIMPVKQDEGDGRP